MSHSGSLYVYNMISKVGFCELSIYVLYLWIQQFVYTKTGFNLAPTLLTPFRR
jgi:hypothetical protein